MNDLIPNQNKIGGILYFLTATLPVIAIALEKWSVTGPANYYAVASVVVGAILAGVIAVKAYMNQSMSQNPSPEDQNKPITLPVTVQPESGKIVTDIIPHVEKVEDKIEKPAEVAPEAPKP